MLENLHESMRPSGLDRSRYKQGNKTAYYLLLFATYNKTCGQPF